MNDVHLWGLDLNLLVVLDVLLRERSVTRAAARLGRTQSAISHALNRLRDALGDELLIREGHMMRPTARGEALAETLPPALDLVRRAVADSGPFDPSTCARTFRLAAPDFLGAALPDLLGAVGAAAPGARVELLPAGEGSFAELAEGRSDLLVAPPALGGRGAVHHEPLGASAWRVVGRPGHPAFACWSAEAWAAWPHLQIRTTGGGSGPVDRAAAAAGRTRTIGAVIPHFATAPAILRRTDLLLTVPRVALYGLVEPFGLEERPVPFELPPMPLALHWSAVLGGEPAVAWFRGRVAQVLRPLIGGGPPQVGAGA